MADPEQQEPTACDDEEAAFLEGHAEPPSVSVAKSLRQLDRKLDLLTRVVLAGFLFTAGVSLFLLTTGISLLRSGSSGTTAIAAVDHNTAKNPPPPSRLCPPDGITTLKEAPDTTYHVFQFSHTHVASTMTTNLLTGLFEGKDQPAGYLEHKRNNWRISHGGKWNSPIESNIVTKTHVTDVDQLMLRYGDQFDHLFFIGNERAEEDNFLPQKYCSPFSPEYENAACLEYAEIQYKTIDELRAVVHLVAERIRDRLPYFSCAELKEDEAVERLVAMAASYGDGHPDKSKVFGTGGGNATTHNLNNLLGGGGDGP